MGGVRFCYTGILFWCYKMEQQSCLSRVIYLFALLETEIKLNSKFGLYDINKICEDVIKDIFNLIHKYKLVNINIVEQKNFPAVDLGDKKKGIAIQVTSCPSHRKIQYTINQFLAKNLYCDYPILKIVALKDRRKHRNPFITKGKISFNEKKDIMDLGDIVTAISSCSADDIKRVKNLLEGVITGKKDSEVQRVLQVIEIFVEKISKLSIIPDEKIEIFNSFGSKYLFCANASVAKRCKNIVNLLREYNTYSVKPGAADKKKEFIVKVNLSNKINYITKIVEVL